MKHCKKCNTTKEKSAFNIKNYKSGHVGLRSYCISCEKLERDVWRKASSKDNDRNKQYNKDHAEEIRGKKLVQNYWPTLTWSQAIEAWNDLYVAQGKHCAVCDESTKLHVDHDHTTGKVRGLLCYNHNNGLGRFQDNVEYLIKIVYYLLKHKTS